MQHLYDKRAKLQEKLNKIDQEIHIAENYDNIKSSIENKIKQLTDKFNKINIPIAVDQRALDYCIEIYTEIKDGENKLSAPIYQIEDLDTIQDADYIFKMLLENFELLALKSNIIRQLSEVYPGINIEVGSSLNKLNTHKKTTFVSNEVNISSFSQYTLTINENNTIDIAFGYNFETKDPLKKHQQKNICCKNIQHKVKHLSLRLQTSEEYFSGEFKNIKIEELTQFIQRLESEIKKESEILSFKKFN